VIGPTGAVRVMVATKPVDFRNYAERRIMRSPGWLTLNWIGFFGRSTPHNFGPSLAVEHRQEFVGRSEPTGPEVGS
jgi:hypothetical protein